MLWFGNGVLLLLCRGWAWACLSGCSEATRGARSYSAATTTTTDRDAAQIYCAALDELVLNAGGHGRELTQ